MAAWCLRGRSSSKGKADCTSPPGCPWGAEPAPGVPVRVMDGVMDLLLCLPPMDGVPVATRAASDHPPAGPPAPRDRSVVAAGMAEMGMSPQEVEAHLTDLDRS